LNYFVTISRAFLQFSIRTGTKRVLKVVQFNWILMLRKITRQDFYNRIPSDQILVRHQFIIFRIFVLALVVSSLVTAFQLIGINIWGTIIGWGLTSLALITICCFYFVNKVERLKYSYVVSLSVGCLMLHLQAYPAGGVLNSGTVYYCAAIMTAYLLLGKWPGFFFSVLAGSSVLFLHFVADSNGWSSFLLFGGQTIATANLADFVSDTMVTFILGFVFVSGFSFYINSNDNVIINQIIQQKDELKLKNDQLENYTQDLERKNQELDKFASIVSHDLKAPLRAIGNLVGWIEEDAGDKMEDDVRSNFDLIKQRVARMENLINAILDYSRADRNENHDDAVDVRQLVKESFDLIGAPKNVNINFKTAFPVVTGDKTRLNQIFSNLIVNAIRYNDKPIVEIDFSAKATSEGWQFSVKDNGPGIDSRFHEKIFVIFQTLHRRDDIESTGVGLAIVKKIVEDQGGKIWVESNLGEGANFCFFWPNKRKKLEMDYALAA